MDFHNANPPVLECDDLAMRLALVKISCMIDRPLQLPDVNCLPAKHFWIVKTP